MSWSVPGYLATDLVGFGATGEVWRGREEQTGEIVALKRLRVPDDADTERLRREADLLARLEHPHLLRLRRTVRSGSEWVLVLDYAAGGNLAGLLRQRRRLRPGEVVTALAPIAAALAHAHGEGVVHGDVTASNVLLTADGRPLLSDLGIARAAGDLDPANLTPEYADPAIARGGLPAAASDLFALAAVAFHALTGVPPWNAATAADALALAAVGDLPDLQALAPEAPPEMVRILERALAADPAARGSAADFGLDLRHCCPPEPIDLPGRVIEPGSAGRVTAVTHTAPGRGRGRVGGDEHRTTAPHHEPRRRLRRLLRSPGLRAGVVVAVGLVVAVRLGIAWAGAGTGHGHAASPAAASRAAASPSPSAQSSGSSSGSPSGPFGPSPTAGASSRNPSATESRNAPARSRPSHAGQDGAHWRQVLVGLDQRRARAFAAAEPALLATVYAPGSDLLAWDRAQVRALRRRGLRATGLTHAVRSVRVVRAAPTRTVLVAEEALRGYRLRAFSGAGISPRAVDPSGRVRYRITLARAGEDAAWRIAAMARGATPPEPTAGHARASDG